MPFSRPWVAVVPMDAHVEMNAVCSESRPDVATSATDQPLLRSVRAAILRVPPDGGYGGMGVWGMGYGAR